MIIFADQEDLTLTLIVQTLAQCSPRNKVLILSPSLRISHLMLEKLKIACSVAYASMGDLHKTKGLSPHHIVVINSDSVPMEQLGPVLAGFRATHFNPMERVREQAKIRGVEHNQVMADEHARISPDLSALLKSGFKPTKDE